MVFIHSPILFLSVGTDYPPIPVLATMYPAAITAATTITNIRAADFADIFILPPFFFAVYIDITSDSYLPLSNQKFIRETEPSDYTVL